MHRSFEINRLSVVVLEEAQLENVLTAVLRVDRSQVRYKQAGERLDSPDKGRPWASKVRDEGGAVFRCS